jgi:2-amino-4-hydroxy-6-hydroxymethyldihydropteridine diphosphokinase
METAFVALGSNLGDPCQNVLAALGRLQSFSGSPLRRSSLWESAPVDCPPGSPMFINAVVALNPNPGETPRSFLARLQFLEKEMGRRAKKIHNEPRVIDLDLIAFGSQTVCAAELTLPHPRAFARRFVLQPLAEIAPDFVLPGQDKKVVELLHELASGEKLRRLSEACRRGAVGGSPTAAGGSPALP